MKLINGDCLIELKKMGANSVDSIVTDPPAGIAFMSKKWDSDKGGRDEWIKWMSEIAAECLRVLKPGGHALVWSLPRTSHWTATAWENAGWELRDRIACIFGSGFPKSLNVGKAIDKAAGVEREVVGSRKQPLGKNASFRRSAQSSQGYRPEGKEFGQAALDRIDITAPATPEAQQWEGWGTALKPAVEDWWLMRKPFKGTIAANVLEHGTGALNIDGCRVGTSETLGRNNNARTDGTSYVVQREMMHIDNSRGLGRYPAHLIHDGSDEVLKCFPETQGEKSTRVLRRLNNTTGWSGGSQKTDNAGNTHKDSGSAARFFKALPDDDPEDEATRVFYCAKAAKKDRGETNRHPCVKSTKLMRYLCRLITPPGGIILDPFMGSGSTGKGALVEGFDFIGIEKEAEYFEIATARLRHVSTSDFETVSGEEQQDVIIQKEIQLSLF